MTALIFLSGFAFADLGVTGVYRTVIVGNDCLGLSGRKGSTCSTWLIAGILFFFGLFAG